MSSYYRPQEVLVMEAELARAKAYLTSGGVHGDLVEANTALLADMVIKTRDELNRSGSGSDVAVTVAEQFRHSMLGGRPAG